MSLGVTRFLDEGQNRLHPTESRIKTLLKEHSWELWGRNAQPPLTDRERAMTRLPMTSCFIYDGADFQATKFCTERVETNKNLSSGSKQAHTDTIHWQSASFHQPHTSLG